LYKILAADFIDKIDWKKVHVFWGDERMVSFSHEKNNARIAINAFINEVGIPDEQVHIIPTEKSSPTESAEQYEKVLKEYFKDQDTTFDLFLLGMSEDGSILSLQPGNSEITERGSWVIPLFNTDEQLWRITLTTPVVNSSAVIAFLITGKRKEDVVQQVLNGKYDPERYPAQLIQPINKPLLWFLDESSAAKIIKPAPL
jgi:6-phosphogluconolactonase